MHTGRDYSDENVMCPDQFLVKDVLSQTCIPRGNPSYLVRSINLRSNIRINKRKMWGINGWSSGIRVKRCKKSAVGFGFKEESLFQKSDMEVSFLC